MDVHQVSGVPLGLLDAGNYDQEGRLLALHPGPSIGTRIYNFVADGLESVSNIGQAYINDFKTADQDVRTGIVRWAANVAEGAMQLAANAQLNSPEMVAAGGFYSRIEQTRQQTLATVPSMRLDKPNYIDGSQRCRAID